MEDWALIRRLAAEGVPKTRAGHSFEEIHEQFDFLERDDVSQVLGYAAELADRDYFLPASHTA